MKASTRVHDAIRAGITQMMNGEEEDKAYSTKECDRLVRYIWKLEKIRVKQTININRYKKYWNEKYWRLNDQKSEEITKSTKRKIQEKS